MALVHLECTPGHIATIGHVSKLMLWYHQQGAWDQRNEMARKENNIHTSLRSV